MFLLDLTAYFFTQGLIVNNLKVALEDIGLGWPKLLRDLDEPLYSIVEYHWNMKVP